MHDTSHYDECPFGELLTQHLAHMTIKSLLSTVYASSNIHWPIPLVRVDHPAVTSKHAHSSVPISEVLTNCLVLERSAVFPESSRSATRFLDHLSMGCCL